MTMNTEKIKVRITESGKVIEVVVLNKRADRIEVVIGEGVHNVRCEMVPTRNSLAYVGKAMDRLRTKPRPGPGRHQAGRSQLVQFKAPLIAVISLRTKERRPFRSVRRDSQC